MYVTQKMMDYLIEERGDTLSVVTTVEGKNRTFLMSRTGSTWRDVRDLFLGGLNLRSGHA